VTTKQPEALRLADLIDNRHCTYGDIDEAADELRRLHEENQQWQDKCNTYIEIHDAVVKDNERLHEVNAELLASVKELLNCIQTDRDWDEGRRARAAIAKATG
jgi:hypothetical protein